MIALGNIGIAGVLMYVFYLMIQAFQKESKATKNNGPSTSFFRWASSIPLLLGAATIYALSGILIDLIPPPGISEGYELVLLIVMLLIWVWIGARPRVSITI